MIALSGQCTSQAISQNQTYERFLSQLSPHPRPQQERAYKLGPVSCAKIASLKEISIASNNQRRLQEISRNQTCERFLGHLGPHPRPLETKTLLNLDLSRVPRSYP